MRRCFSFQSWYNTRWGCNDGGSGVPANVAVIIAGFSLPGFAPQVCTSVDTRISYAITRSIITSTPDLLIARLVCGTVSEAANDGEQAGASRTFEAVSRVREVSQKSGFDQWDRAPRLVVRDSQRRAGSETGCNLNGIRRAQLLTRS